MAVTQAVYNVGASRVGGSLMSTSAETGSSKQVWAFVMIGTRTLAGNSVVSACVSVGQCNCSGFVTRKTPAAVAASNAALAAPSLSTLTAVSTVQFVVPLLQYMPAVGFVNIFFFFVVISVTTGSTILPITGLCSWRTLYLLVHD